MEKINYYNEIKNLIENYEVSTRVRVIQDNHDKLMTNWQIGKLLVDAQGGKNRAKYGDNLIKKWSLKLVSKYGSKYNYRELQKMRKFYLVFPKLPTMSANLSWSVIVELFSLKSVEERNYYMNQTLLNHLSVRELREMIKSKAYNRLSYADKENIKLMDNTNHLTIEDMIKDPILIKADNQMQNLNEQALHKYIINMLEKRFLELGSGFALVGHEVKMVEENHTFKIDLLFFNYELNSFVVVELKTRTSKPQDVGQLEFYVHLVDKQLKKNNHNKTVGLLIVKKKNQYILEYTTNKELFVTTYKLML